MHEKEGAGFFGEGAEDVSAIAWSQEESAGDGPESSTGEGGGGVCNGGREELEATEEEEEEDMMDSGSTVKDFGVNAHSDAIYSSSMQGADVEPHVAVNAGGEGESDSSGGTPAERAAKRRRLLSCADERSGRARSQGAVRAR